MKPNATLDLNQLQRHHMTHIHIALVGGQRYPVYLGIMDRQPNEVVFVHSDNTEIDAKKIAAELPKNIKTNFENIDPVDVEVIFKTTESMAKKAAQNASNKYSINISGGTKIWSIAFYKYFFNVPNAEIFYIDQNNYYWGLQPVSEHPTNIELKTNVVLRLNGQTIKDATNFNDYDQKDAEAANQLEKLFEMGNVYKLVNEKIKNYPNQKKGIVSRGVNYLEWDKDKQSIEIQLFDNHFQLTSPHLFQLVFNFAWFEYKIAKLLSNWVYAKEILLNVKFSSDIHNIDKNETDIVVNTGYRLLFVECKTKIAQPTDIDKFRTVVKNFGGSGCKGLFIQREKISPLVREKCSESDIICYSLKENYKNPTQLFKILERELFEINKK